MPKIFGAHRVVAFVFCLSTLLSSGVHAQSGPARPPERPVNSGSDPLATNKLAPAGHNERPGSVPADPAHKAEPGAVSLLAAPKVGLRHPLLNLELKSREVEEDAVSFAVPEAESEYAPRGFQATAYSLRGRTASGAYVYRGAIAADPRVLPIGTVVYVKAGEYSGIYTVHDVGPKVKGRTVDIWMSSSREARKFGRRRVKLQVLRYGPRPDRARR
jgi:3D (Asp-Asp-Asp) domain-containing protein